MVIRFIILFILSFVMVSCEDLGSQFIEPTYDFTGVKSADYDAAGQVTIYWDEVTFEGELDPVIEYQVFVIPQTNSSDLVVSDSNYAFSQTNLIPDEASLAAPVVDTKRNYATFNWKYELGKTFIIYVRAKNLNDGTIISANQSFEFAVRSNAPIFDGLQETEVSTDATGNIVLEWEPARDTVGSVQYLIFDSTTFVTPLAITKSTTYTIENPIKGRTYNLAVRAQDDRGQDDNNEVVAYLIPDPSDKTPPEFGGLKQASAISEKSILLKWDPSPSDDIAVYRIYNSNNLVSPIATTSSDRRVISPLSIDTEYNFVVRAVDTNGNIEQNIVIKGAKTLPYEVPQFLGISQASPRPGFEGLTKIKLTWTPAVFNPTIPAPIRGYQVYYTKKDEDFPAVANITSQNPSLNQVLITGLKENTTYKFLVRAYYQDGSGAPILEELNENIKTVSTLARTAPTFAGVAAVGMDSLDSGSALVELKWNAAGSDGIFTGYRVTYEEGPCSEDFTDAASQVEVAGTSNNSHVVPGFIVGSKYKFKVNTFFPAVGTYPEIIDTNDTCIDFVPELTPPSFDGVASIIQQGNTNDFSEFTATWAAPQGDCSRIEVSLSKNPFTPNFITPIKVINDCSATSTVLNGLERDTTYYVQVRAVLENSGNTYISGEGNELFVTTNIDIEDNDGVKETELIPVTGGTDLVEVKWDLPASGTGWNQIYVWRSFHIDEPTAKANVKAFANLFTNSGDKSSAATISKDATDYTNTETTMTVEANVGGYNCFLSRAVFDDGINFAASSNERVECVRPVFNLPTFTGVASAAYKKNLYDTADKNKGYLELIFKAKPTGSYDGFHIYYSKFKDPVTFNLEHPIHTVNRGSEEDKSSEGLSGSLLAKMNLSKIKSGYYIVRWFSYGSLETDPNTAVSTLSPGLGTNEMQVSEVYPNPVGERMTIGFRDSVTFQNTYPNDAWVVMSDSVDANGSLDGELENIQLGSGECANAPSNPCEFDLGPDGMGLDKWEPRFFQLFARNGSDITKSPVYGHARVPPNMVYVDKNLWPQEKGRYLKYWDRYSYAIDKYDLSLINFDLIDPNDFYNFFFSNDGTKYPPLNRGSREKIMTVCHARIPQDLNPNNPDKGQGFANYAEVTEFSSASRNYHTMNALDYYIASTGTPDISSSSWNRTTDDRGCGMVFNNHKTTKRYYVSTDQIFDNDKCISQFGVRGFARSDNRELAINESGWMNGSVYGFHRFAAPRDSVVDDNNITQFNPEFWHKAELTPNTSIHTPSASWRTGYDRRPYFRNIDWEYGLPIYGNLESGGNDYFDYNIIFDTSNPLFRDYLIYRSKGLGGYHRLSHRITTGSPRVRCSIAAPTPGKLKTQNDSLGSFARIKWRAWGESTSKIRIALAKSQKILSTWDGKTEGGSLDSDLYVITDYSGCTDTDFNNHYFDLDDDSDTMSTFSSHMYKIDPVAVSKKPMNEYASSDDAFRLQGRCGIDLSSLAPWEKRWIRVSITYEDNNPLKGDTHIVGRVPDNMVLVAKEDWPEKEKHPKAAKLGESYSKPYDFAIDKYLVKISNLEEDGFPTNLDGTKVSRDNYGNKEVMRTNGSEMTNDGRDFSYESTNNLRPYLFSLCDHRTESLDPSWGYKKWSPQNVTTGKRVHVLRGIEYVVASFGTPNAYNASYCMDSNTQLYETFSTALTADGTRPATGLLNPLVDYYTYFKVRGEIPNKSFDQTLFGSNGSDNCISRYGVRNMLGFGMHITNEYVKEDGTVGEWFYRDSRTEGETHKNGVDLGISNQDNFYIHPNSDRPVGVVKEWDFENAWPLEIDHRAESFARYDFGAGAVYNIKNTKQYIARGGSQNFTDFYAYRNLSENNRSIFEVFPNQHQEVNTYVYWNLTQKDHHPSTNNKGMTRPNRFAIGVHSGADEATGEITGSNIGVGRCALRSPFD